MIEHGTPGAYATGGCRCEPCTTANRNKQRDYYATPKGKAVYAKMGRTRLAKIRAWVNEQKQGWCLDCGYIGPPEAMDFDHRPEEGKSYGVSEMVKRRMAMTRIAKEILKCDLVCANCHRIRTASRHQNATLA